MSASSRHVVIVGGGLAGLAAAISCAEEGARVSLFEARPRLGGATWSFERNGLRFDNGQHVFLRCCTAYRALLDRLGTADSASLQDRLSVPVLRRDESTGRVDVAEIRRNSLPAPAHLIASLLRYRHLPVRDRLRAIPAALAIKRVELDDATLDDQTFASFLSAHGQSQDSVSRFWDLITLPTVNVHANEASFALAAKVFKTGLLDETDAADIGWAHVPLEDVHVRPAAALVEKLGGTIHQRTKAKSIETVGDGATRRVTAVVTESGRIDTDAVIVAVPHRQAAELVPRTARSTRRRFLDSGRHRSSTSTSSTTAKSPISTLRPRWIRRCSSSSTRRSRPDSTRAGARCLRFRSLGPMTSTENGPRC